MPEISIIVPIYNSAGTLSPCLQAVANQSFQNYELLLCDDGSSDQSMEICRSAAGQDSRLCVLPLSHAGVSSARNAGLEHAQGRYIAFADSDDLPDQNWLSTLRKNAQPNSLSVCGYTVRSPEGTTLYTTKAADQNDAYDELTPLQFLEDVFSNSRMYQGYVWNKLFSRRLIETDIPLRFDERIYFNEDRLFLFWYLRRCRSISFSNTSVYNYIRKPPSREYHPAMKTELFAFDILCNELKRLGLKDILFYAEKDRFRAAATLYRLARQNGADDDSLYYEEEVLRYQDYLAQFRDYPLTDQEAMALAVAEAKNTNR